MPGNACMYGIICSRNPRRNPRHCVESVSEGRFMDSNVLLLGGKFKVEFSEENKIKEGELSTVWLGTDVRTKQHVPVAVKQVQRKSKTEICWELNLLQECKHQNIIQLIYSIKSESSFFLVLEYCAAGNLNDFVKDRYIDFRACLGYMIHISSGLQFMHWIDIGHFDIKPENVLVANDQCMKLADLGLSRKITDKQSSLRGQGTVAWMAPEQFAVRRPKNDQKYGLAADIFSLGLLFHSLLVHQRGKYLKPYEGNPLSCDWW